MSVCKFFSTPFSSTLLQKWSGSPSWRPRPEYSQVMYELELCTYITCTVVFDVFGFTGCRFIFWCFNWGFFIPSWSPYVGWTACSGNNWVSRDMHNAVLFYMGSCMQFSLTSFLHGSYWSYDHISTDLVLPSVRVKIYPAVLIPKWVRSMCVSYFGFQRWALSVVWRLTWIFFDNFCLIPKFPGLEFTRATPWMYVVLCVGFRDCTPCAYEV